MSRINVLSELSTAEKINPGDAIQQEEFDILAWELRDNLHARALALFLYDSGVRPTEAAKLRCSWVMPYDNAAIVQYHGLTRLVKYGDYAGQALIGWLKARPKVAHDRVFFDPMSYEPFTREKLTKYLGQLLISVDLARPGLNIWSFRSSFALRILPGTPPKAARFMLGLPGAGQANAVYGEDISSGFTMAQAMPKKFLSVGEVIALIEADKASR